MEQYTLEAYDGKGNRVCTMTATGDTRYEAARELHAARDKTPGSIYVFKTDRKRARDGRLPLFRHNNRMTHSNCALSPAKLADRYAAWAVKQGLKTIHLFPAGRTGHSAEVHYRLRNTHALAIQGVTFTEVNPVDWAPGTA